MSLYQAENVTEICWGSYISQTWLYTGSYERFYCERLAQARARARVREAKSLYLQGVERESRLKVVKNVR